MDAPLVSARHSIKCINPSAAVLSLHAGLNQHHQTYCLLPRHEVLAQQFAFRRHPSSSEKRMWRKYWQKTSLFPWGTQNKTGVHHKDTLVAAQQLDHRSGSWRKLDFQSHIIANSEFINSRFNSLSWASSYFSIWLHTSIIYVTAISLHHSYK